MPNITVRAAHFEDLGGSEFERLVFAYHLRAGWSDLAWYGQTGSDEGRDIIGTEPFDDAPNRRTVIQCVNRSSLTQAKAEKDMAGAVASPTGKPAAFKFVCRSAVSAGRRDAVQAAAKALGIDHLTIWSGVEFEEQLRLRAEFLLKRFLNGEVFPDDGAGLRTFVDQFPDISDEETLQMYAAVLDRPAFTTPFHLESYLPAFEQALADTISALNTGIWRTRDAVEIRRIPSLHHLKSASLRDGAATVVRQLDEVRRAFKRRLNDGTIKPCGCGDPNCPTFMIPYEVAHEMDRLREQALLSFKAIYPAFKVRVR